MSGSCYSQNANISIRICCRKIVHGKQANVRAYHHPQYWTIFMDFLTSIHAVLPWTFTVGYQREKHLRGAHSLKLNKISLGSLTSCGQMKLIFCSMPTLIPIIGTTGLCQDHACAQINYFIPPKSQCGVDLQVPSS